MPLLREGDPVGVIFIRRTEVRPFSEKQIALLKTFADQAVIAIENVRLFQELKESLEQQTATSEILGAIASSPTDLEPVLNTIAERARAVCGAEDGVLRLVDGNVLRLAAHYGSIPHVAVERPINRQSPPGRALIDQAIIHHEDVDQLIESEFPEMLETRRQIVARTFLAVPLIREGVALGSNSFPTFSRFVHSRTNRSRCSKLLPTKRSSRSRTCGCSRNFRSATQNCARL